MGYCKQDHQQRKLLLKYVPLPSGLRERNRCAENRRDASAHWCFDARFHRSIADTCSMILRLSRQAHLCVYSDLNSRAIFVDCIQLEASSGRNLNLTNSKSPSAATAVLRNLTQIYSCLAFQLHLHTSSPSQGPMSAQPANYNKRIQIRIGKESVRFDQANTRFIAPDCGARW